MSLAISELVKGLVFPVAVLLLGALVSGLLIPELTRRRDDHRKALEIKTELVEEISESVMRFVMAVQFVVLGSASQTQEKYDEAYRAWETESAVIATKLAAYFRQSNIAGDWSAFAERVTRFYALTGVDLSQRRHAARPLMETYGLRWQGSDDPPTEQAWRQAWGTLKDAIFSEKTELIRRVLESPLDAFEGRRPLSRPGRS